MANADVAGLILANNGSSSSIHHQDHDSGCRRCRSCASSALVVDWAAGDRVCTNCGMVDEGHLLEERAEWREFDDDNDRARNACGGGTGTRCSMVATNESRWIGGLQPTSLSKHIYGRPTPTSSSTRKQLVMVNQRLDRMMEKKYESEVKHAQLSLKIRKSRLERKRRRGDGQEETEDEDNNDGEDNVRPEFDQLLVHEEENLLATTAALHADKWSLDRAIRLFGNGHQLDSLSNSRGDDHEEELERLRSGMDGTLTAASRDLHAAYSMLVQSANTLQLPERITNEATATLCKYAARRDGLTVRGVSSQLKKKNKKSDDEESEKLAREALKEFNKARQMGSLVAALLFYISRNLNCPRTLVQICASVELPSDIQSTSLLDLGEGAEFIKKKHCSKAMNEIKQVFPDLTRSVAPTTAQASLLHDKNASSESLANHISRKLRLPPVAEASVRALVVEFQEQQKEAAEAMAVDTKKKFAMCAAISHFVCQIGEIMQGLAKQASAADQAKKNRRLSNAACGSSSLLGTFQDGSNDILAGTEPESQAFDIFSDTDAASQEHREYEMRRVWDAWREQTAWRRLASEIEHAAGISLPSIESFYKTFLFPKRRDLLEALTGNSKNKTSGESHWLSKISLASVLLPHVSVVEPLLKETISAKDALTFHT